MVPTVWVNRDGVRKRTQWDAEEEHLTGFGHRKVHGHELRISAVKSLAHVLAEQNPNLEQINHGHNIRCNDIRR